MKKKLLRSIVTAFTLLLSSTPTSLFAFAKDTQVDVIIPDYSVTIDNSSIYYADSLYPFINYGGITYFPMTYNYCRVLNLAVSWDSQSGLFISYHPSNGALPVYETTVNSKNCTALVPQYDIYINSKKFDNSSAKYPLLNFRGVTYFPLT